MTTAPAPKPATNQLQDIFLRYRTMKLDDNQARQDLAEHISQSNLPSYHKEVMMAVFFPKSPEELTISLAMVQIQERQRHESAMSTIVGQALQARLQRLT